MDEFGNTLLCAFIYFFSLRFGTLPREWTLQISQANSSWGFIWKVQIVFEEHDSKKFLSCSKNTQGIKFTTNHFSVFSLVVLSIFILLSNKSAELFYVPLPSRQPSGNHHSTFCFCEFY
jgi:hypothetical protein